MECWGFFNFFFSLFHGEWLGGIENWVKDMIFIQQETWISSKATLKEKSFGWEQFDGN
jgi:hypothetical protein